VGEGTDVGVEEEGLAVFEEAVGVLEVGLAFADGLDLGAAEGDAGFDAVGEEVVEAGGAVEGGVAEAGGDGVAVFLLHRRLVLGGGRGRIGEGTGHEWNTGFAGDEIDVEFNNEMLGAESNRPTDMLAEAKVYWMQRKGLWSVPMPKRLR
jgi:hypothetical protein